MSLAVKDIAASKQFYLALGFQVVGGDESQNWLILRNGSTTIGLFHGMFDQNILTFNPGWNAQAQALEKFEDLRDLQRGLRDAGVDIQNPVDEETKGPGSFVLVDPDGNTILIDQHVESPA